ncbi:MAG: hypothetical protein AAF432_05250 [Planctomycetota bacterium]
MMRWTWLTCALALLTVMTASPAHAGVIPTPDELALSCLKELDATALRVTDDHDTITATALSTIEMQLAQGHVDAAQAAAHVAIRALRQRTARGTVHANGLSARCIFVLLVADENALAVSINQGRQASNEAMRSSLRVSTELIRNALPAA